MEKTVIFTQVPDLTTKGLGVNPDAEPLVYAPPLIQKLVPGQHWAGRVNGANAIMRFPSESHWNGKLLIGGIPAVRSEYSLDLILSDIALQQGYAFAACDKATPGLTLRDVTRSMEEWTAVYKSLTDMALAWTEEHYGVQPTRTYIAGLSNGGYVVRAMLEKYPELFDGGVEWEGVFWNPSGRHLLTTLPVYVREYPVYMNWRGDRSLGERATSHERLLEAGLHPNSAPFWDKYFLLYWIVSLWLYGRSLDPDWKAFQAPWSNDWLRDASAIADYPWQDRVDVLAERIRPFANTGIVTKPLLSVAGNWDCLVPFTHHAKGYAEYVRLQGYSEFHRLYEIDGGNHVDGMLEQNRAGQQPVQPYFEAALYHLEAWVEQNVSPPASGIFQHIGQFTKHPSELYSWKGATQ